MTKKLKIISLYAAPILVMIGLIPFVENEYVLALIYVGFVAVLMYTKSEANDWLALLFGLIGITISEYFFVSTGVETFTQQTLLGVMPLWLPVLWAYAFVTIKRCLRILDN